jgi:predicted dienelactone hydrolase
MTLSDLITTALLTLFLLLALFGVKRWRVWSSALLGLAVATEVTRLAVGHARWQLLPAYLVVLVALAASACMHHRGCRRWLAERGRVRAFLASLALVTLAMTPVAYASFPMFELPRPTGALGVGMTQLHLRDLSRPEVHTANPVDQRELMVRVWYPADVNGCQRYAPYLEHAGAIAGAVNDQQWPLGTMLSHLDQIATHACIDAPVAGQQHAYPLLVFSHALSLGYAAQNTVLMEELASRGYVIFSIDHSYDGLATVFPNGRVTVFRAEGWDAQDGRPSADYMREVERLQGSLDTYGLLALAKRSVQERPVEARLRRFWYEQWSQDQRFVLDQLERVQSGEERTPLAGHLQLDRIGLFGMSFGGATAAWTCARDERCKAGMNLDGFGNVLIENPPHRQPFMSMNSEGQTANAMFLDSDLDYRYYAQVRGATHFDYSDAGLISPLAKVALRYAEDAGDPIETQRVLELTNTYVRAFFDRHLLGRPCELLDGPSPRYPEVVIMARGPAAR